MAHITEEDKKWLIENYPHKTQRECRAHLKICYETLRELILECGLELRVRNGGHKDERKVRQHHKDIDAQGNYCLGCCNYIPGSCSCRMTGKYVGALWEKKCFNRKEQQ